MARWTLPFLLTTLTVLLGCAGCSDPAPAAAEAGTVAEAAAPDPGAGGGGEAADLARLSFDRPRASETDVAVTEVRTYVIRVQVEGDGDLPGVKLASSCGCLSARFLTPLTREGAQVEVRIEGEKPEDIDGVIFLEDERGTILAEHVVTIFIQYKTYVVPRGVELGEGQEEFQVGVYRAFPPRQEDPILDLADFRVDEERFELTWMDTESAERITPDYQRLGYDLTFQVLEAARQGPLESTLELLVAEPEETLEVPIRRKAADGSP